MLIVILLLLITMLVNDSVTVEDTKHFILECPLYFNLRQEMLTVISEFCLPSLNVILFGNPDLTTHSNTRIFDAVQSFILKTKRFVVNQ